MQALQLGLPTLLLIAAYLAGINLLGARLGRGQKDARDYFLGSHAMPWGAVLASIVATETSALTFLSVPGDAYSSGYTFLQLVLGYVVGRIAVAGILLSGYFEREYPTAYALLEARFGVRARRFTSLLFMVTRVLAAAVRLAVPAIPIALLLGIPVWAAILLLACGTALYTLLGGLKAVIWIDLIQVFLYLSGAAIALAVLLSRVPGGLSGAFAAHAAAGEPVRFFDFRFDLSLPYTFWSGVLGGAFLTMATHGADQLIVQRLLACRSLGDARRALVGSGFLVFAQMALFTTIGVLLFAFFGGRRFDSPDAIFPTFLVKDLPPLLSAYLVAGIFSAAMCSESSALNSLASALALDVVGPRSGRGALEGRSGLRLGRALTVFWTVVLAGLSVGFSLLPRTQPAVQVALGLASVTAGGLLGAFLLARYAMRATESDVLWAIGLSTTAVFLLWLGGRGWAPVALGRRIAWPWYSLIGCALAVGVGFGLSLRHARPRPG
ncbi:MAG TPA: sodium:solute symporter [Thermoanaerobaculia bacterium]|jgi:SSS family transporter